MSMNKSAYLVLGFKFTVEELKSWGFADDYFDELQQFFEGHPGVPFNILCGENTKYMYAGIVLASSKQYSDDTCVAVEVPNKPDLLNKLHEQGLIGCNLSDIKLYFVDLWS